MSLDIFTVEVIESIVKIIEQDNDLRSLYNFCLTNRTLCKISIPYLWRRSLINTSDDRREYLIINPSSIISVLLSFIRNTNIKYFLKKNYKDYFDIPTKSLFNYPSFIRQIDFSFLLNSVQLWLSSNNEFYRYSSCVDENKWKYFQDSCGKRNVYFSHNIVLALTEMIFRTIIKNTDEFEAIYITVYNDDGSYIDFDENYFYNRLFGLYDAQKCLSRLKKFKIKGFLNMGAIINQITNCNPKLTNVCIQKHDYGLKHHQLMKFLLNQNHLTKVTINGLSCERSYNWHEVGRTMTPSLESLKILGYSITDDLLRFFVNCNRLKKFQMIDVTFIRSNNILKEIIFPELEELKITVSQFSFRDEYAENEIKLFIVHHINNLKKIEIKTSDEHHTYYLNFVKKIPSLIFNSNCLNFTELFLQIDETYFSIILNILEKSKNLQRLELTKFFENSKILNDQFLKDISNKSNENLKFLNFCNWKISVQGLKIILVQKRLRLKKFYCTLYNGNYRHIEGLITKYKEFNDRVIISKYKIMEPCVDYHSVKESSNDHIVNIEWGLNLKYL